MPDSLMKLDVELTAINAWDAAYHRSTLSSKIDEDAFRIRQIRRRQIQKEIQSSATTELCLTVPAAMRAER
jgi:hypothetical protein